MPPPSIPRSAPLARRGQPQTPAGDNIAPPGWERGYSKLRDALNLEHGWARPDDPARAREVAFELSPPWAQHGFHLKAGKEAVHGYVTRS